MSDIITRNGIRYVSVKTAMDKNKSLEQRIAELEEQIAKLKDEKTKKLRHLLGVIDGLREERATIRKQVEELKDETIETYPRRFKPQYDKYTGFIEALDKVLDIIKEMEK